MEIGLHFGAIAFIILMTSHSALDGSDSVKVIVSR